ncbi:MAG: hypothetical protein LUD50_07945 [Clostridia bacterium]|nr:hypothetical protein [Clostridia bacterium]
MRKAPASEYKKNLYAFHNHSPRHVLTLEADLTEQQKRFVFNAADRLRRCGNALAAIMMKNYEQLLRTKKYRAILKAYGRAVEANNRKLKKELSNKLAAMQKQYNVTWEFCQNKALELVRTYKSGATCSIARAESIWYGVEKLLYSGGEKLRFKERGDLPIIRAKQTTAAIVIYAGEKGGLSFYFRKINFTNIDKPHDKFVNDELSAVWNYLQNPDENDRKAVEAYMKDGTLTDTYRPCYAALKCVVIRGRLRVFIQITIEGKAMKKYRKVHDASGNVIQDSNGKPIYIPRHTYGTGNVGVDIGTQTFAYTSRTEVGVKNLAERGDSIKHCEAKSRRLKRAMTRSRIATNPDNYNPDGTNKRGKRTWIRSRRYMKLWAKYKELNRIAAENRHYAINEDVNHLRELGDVFITEPGIASGLMKKIKPQSEEELADPAVKNRCRKRYGRSIRNRCPGYFQSRAKQVFEITGGRYVEVSSNNYKASQYDHIADVCIKRKLGQRKIHLGDGTVVLRDWYSSFLLYNADMAYESVDKAKCRDTFPSFYLKELDMIEEIKQSGKIVMNTKIYPAQEHKRKSA